MPLGPCENNVAHSNKRFGLRFFIILPRMIPCNPIRDDSLLDPWSANPSIPTIYKNFTTFKNAECGVLAEYMGNAIFQDFYVVDSYNSAF